MVKCSTCSRVFEQDFMAKYHEKDCAGDKEPKAYTRDEMSMMMAKQIAVLTEYWRTVDTDLDRLEGLVHSIIVMLDGCGALPLIKLIPDPDPSDKDFDVEGGQNYWTGEEDIGYSLRTQWNKLVREKDSRKD